MQSNTIDEIPKDPNNNNISKTKKYLLVIYGVIQMFISSGVLFGWPSMLLILWDQNVYSSACTIGEQVPCDAQNVKLNLIYCICI